MPVILTLVTGEKRHIDRGMRLDQVTEIINADRGTGRLTTFDNDQTPSRKFSVDSDAVIAIDHDGY